MADDKIKDSGLIDEVQSLQTNADGLNEHLTTIEIINKQLKKYSETLEKFVSDLFENSLFSDLDILLQGGRRMDGHKVVLASRSREWSVEEFDQVDVLDLTDMNYETSYCLVKWVYTDSLDINIKQDIAVQLLKASKQFGLNSLSLRCQRLLMKVKNVEECKNLLQIAEETSAEYLKQHCTLILISSQVEDVNKTERIKKTNKPAIGSNRTISGRSKSLKTMKQNISSDTKEDNKNILGSLLSCSNCENKFKTKNALKQHLKVQHNRKHYKCSFCDQEFSWNNQLLEHQTVHTGKRPHECDVCNRPFKNKHALEAHSRIHSGEKPYCCDICGKSFRQAGSLTTHKRTHSGEKPFQCNICSKSFSQRFNLRHHIQTHTQERRHMCDICGRAFVNPSNLSQHIQIHVGQKKFTCNECGKSFLFNKYLTKHKKIHARQHEHLETQIPGYLKNMPFPSNLNTINTNLNFPNSDNVKIYSVNNNETLYDDDTKVNSNTSDLKVDLNYDSNNSKAFSNNNINNSPTSDTNTISSVIGSSLQY